MLSSFLITLREGLEAALIIGIVLAYLSRTGNRRGYKHVWIGTGIGIAISLLVGGIIYLTARELSGRAEEIFEGSVMFLAVAVLTWMVFWMRKQSINIRDHLYSQVKTAMDSGSSLGLVVLAFLAVGREGIETVLFLFAATQLAESPAYAAAGGLLGLALAAGIGYVLFKGSVRLNLRMFFDVTGFLLILFAAGLLAHGIHEFHEAGLIPPVVEHVWDINTLINEKSTFGRFLTAIFGYNANPSLVEVLSYGVFLAVVLAGYFRRPDTRRKNMRPGRIASSAQGLRHGSEVETP
jgi:high-affinity iron transporter